MRTSPYGTGGAVRQGIQAVTAALQGVLAGNMAQALTGAAAPYLAEAIHRATTDAAGNTDVAANTLAHALLGAVVAQASGNNALAGAAGEAGGELAAHTLIEALYPGKKPSELNEEQKQYISTLATIAGGLAAGVVGNTGADAVQGAQSAQVAVENNFLSADQSLSFDKELSECRKSGGDCQAVIDKWKKISDRQSAETDQKLKDNPQEAVVVDKEIAQGGVEMTERPGWLGNIPGVDVMTSDEAKAYVQQWNSQDLARIDTNSPEWVKYAAFISDPENQAMLVSGGLLAKDVTKAAISFMSRNTATATVSASEIGMQWGAGNIKQGMPWEDYVGKALPENARLPQNFKTFDYYDPMTKTAVSAKSMDTQTMAKLANPNQVYSSIKGNIDAAAKFDSYTLSRRTLDSSMITSREVQLAVPTATTSAQWTEINRAIEYGKNKGVTVKVIQVK
ncbi:VENN motif pre-toxin domain-containing protein [Dickeya oryzae]|nr:VENN motif pre-toxin domain-containing protein [Dickeya oryzae]